MSKIPLLPAPLRAVVTILLLALAGFGAAPRALAQPANASPPERMTYQGFLADSAGIPLGNSAPKNYDVVFKIYDAPSGANAPLWGEQQTVTVDKGYFSILLGEGTAVGNKPPLSSLFTNTTASDRFVEVTVNGIGAPATPNVIIAPRIRLMTSPYAFLATKALNVDGAAITAGTVTDAKLATISTAGKVADSALSGNVALRNAANNFTGDQFSTTAIGAKSATASAGYIDMVPGTATAAGYIEFFKPGPTRMGYLGWRDGGQNNIGLNLENSANFNINGGNVGIGTTTPTQGKLHIAGGGPNGPSYAGGASGWYANSGGQGIMSAGAPFVANAVSIYTANSIWCNAGGGGGFVETSDERIKAIQGRSDSAADLRALSRIEITDYRYKDTVANGNDLYKKVIAQQVERVFPQAVSKHTGVVPDIYELATYKDGWVTLATDLKKGERVKLIADKNEGSIHEVLEVTRDKFRTDFKPAGDKVFVYGREVNDFRTVEYDAIAMLNVSATQELARRLEQKSAQVAKLEQEMADLKKLVAQLAGTDKAAKATAQAAPQDLPGGAIASLQGASATVGLDR